MDAPWQPRNGPLDEPPGEWFVNRKAELDRFWEWGSGVPHNRRLSYALVGLRRTGKTAIMHKVFNRLFYEQERVLPVHISFVQYLNKPEPISAYEFAEEYFAGYMRSYLSFRYKRPDFHQDLLDIDALRIFSNEMSDELAIDLFRTYDREPRNKRTAAHNKMQWVINIPKGKAWTNDMPTAMFVDEFQVLTRVYNPDSGQMRDLTDSFQPASESRDAPMLVSGSSVSMLVGQALGGLVSGRFTSIYLDPLTEEHAIDMIYRLGESNGIEVTQKFASALWEWTKGYPYAIESIMNSVSPAVDGFPDIDKLNETVRFELTNRGSLLWGHYETEYGKYVTEFNGDKTARMVLLWIANHVGKHIHPKKVAAALDLEMLDVSAALEKLYTFDIIERVTPLTFMGPTDPLLAEFLKYAHYVDIDDLAPADAQAKLEAELNKKQGEVNRLVGHFAEIVVGGVVKNLGDRAVDGETYFNVAGEVTLPQMVEVSRRDGVIKEGIPHELDVIGEYALRNGQSGKAGRGAWLVSVRYREKRMGMAEVEQFIKQIDSVQADRGYGHITRWYFSKSGFTQESEQKMRDEGIYFSDLAQFNALAELLGFLPILV